MGLSLQISLGDIIVAGSIVTSTILAYTAFKGLLAITAAQLTAIVTRLDSQAKRLGVLTRASQTQGQKIAGLEGAVFSRRSSDHADPDPDDVHDESL